MSLSWCVSGRDVNFFPVVSTAPLILFMTSSSHQSILSAFWGLNQNKPNYPIAIITQSKVGIRFIPPTSSFAWLNRIDRDLWYLLTLIGTCRARLFKRQNKIWDSYDPAWTVAIGTKKHRSKEHRCRSYASRTRSPPSPVHVLLLRSGLGSYARTETNNSRVLLEKCVVLEIRRKCLQNSRNWK